MPMNSTKKVLVCSGRLWHYPKAIARGFQDAGCDVRLLEYATSSILKLERTSFLQRIHPWFQLKNVNKNIFSTVKRIMPDIVLVVNGEELFAETIRAITEKATIAHWAVDGIANLKTHIEVFNEYNKNFVFEPCDVPLVPRAEFLPLAADLSIFYPRGGGAIHREYDVSFVGAPHPGRLPFLEKIAAGAHGKFGFHVFGPFSKIDKTSFPRLAECITKSAKLSPEEIAEIYSKSKISLNPHHEQSMTGVNPRVFEMSACETFQLCSDQKCLCDFFPGNEIEVYENADDCLQKIEKFLHNSDERSARAKAAGKIVRENHTFKERAKHILHSV